MDTRALIVGWLVWVGAGPALAQDPTKRWHGAWQVEGRTCWRHVGGSNDALEMEARVDDLDVRLRGRGDARGLTLEGVGERVSGEPAVWRQHAMRLEARAARDGSLEVTVEVAGDSPRRERWLRPAAARLTVTVVGGGAPGQDEPPIRGARRRETPLAASRSRAAEPDVVRVEPGAGDVVFEVVVEGRPMTVALQVVAAADDARYAHLGGLVHHVDLAGGASLPVGRHRVTWSGMDRSIAERPLLPGRYSVTVASGDEPLGPPPGEDAPARAALALVVADAPAALVARDASGAPAASTPAPRSDGGLASRLGRTGAPSSP